MESIYYLIYDNISEIIFITYQTKLALHISIANKQLFPNFYNLPRIIKNFKHKHKSKWNLSDFHRLKVLTFDNRFENENKSYRDLQTLTTLQILKINGSISDPESIDLRHFTNLKILYFPCNDEVEEIKFNHTCITQLVNTIYTTNIALHTGFCNIFDLNIKMKACINHFFANYVYTRLTHLTLRFNSLQFNICINQKYSDSLISLSLERSKLSLASQQWLSLTSLELNNCWYPKFACMPQLKSLTIKNTCDVRLNGFENVHMLTYLCFENVDSIHVHNWEKEQNAWYATKLSSLLKLKIKKCKYFMGKDIIMKYCSKNLEIVVD